MKDHKQMFKVQGATVMYRDRNGLGVIFTDTKKQPV